MQTGKRTDAAETPIRNKIFLAMTDVEFRVMRAPERVVFAGQPDPRS
jgi:hypothetical protein